MLNMSLINKKVSEFLREENNEVIYKAWLFVTEDARLEDGNIVLEAPNYYMKNCLEERYILDIEALYRKELSFKQIIINVALEPAIAAAINVPIGTTKEILTEGSFTHTLDHFLEKINEHVKDLYESVEAANQTGQCSISCTLSHEPFHKEEIYWHVKDFMLNKGFKAELNKLDSDYALELSW